MGAEIIARRFGFYLYAFINRFWGFMLSFEQSVIQPKKTDLYRITDTFTEWLEQDIYCDPTQYLYGHIGVLSMKTESHRIK